MDKPLSEKVNDWRLFPRIFMSYYIYLSWTTGEWYKALPEPTDQQSLYAGTIIGLLVPLCKWYYETGKKNEP